ncbi:hypothetical protein AAKU67_002183 [Oxalobacteraceae bacterium GrIS 2.11]
MEISFPNLVMPKLTAMGTISFQTLVDGEYLWCEISCEALRDHFGAVSMDRNDLLVTFHKFKEEIQQVARQCLEIDGGHPILLMAANFK